MKTLVPSAVDSAAELGALYLLLALSVRSLRPRNVIRIVVRKRRSRVPIMLGVALVYAALAASRT